MELIRNCSHFSSTCTFIQRDQNLIPEKIIKISLSKDGVQNIKREYQGLTWYCNQLSIDPEQVVILKNPSDDYSIIEIKYIPGQVGVFTPSLEKNFNKIINAITYYVRIFMRTNFSWSHGDYSINNIIYSGDQVEWLIDWESFNEKLPIWFDCVNCVLEAVFFQYKLKKQLSDPDLKRIQYLISYLSEFFPMRDLLMEKPASKFRSFFYAYKEDVFLEQINKYPYVNAKDEDIHYLDIHLAKIIPDRFCTT